MRKKYLSLDVDFWNDRSYDELRDVMERVKRLQKKGLELRIVDSHDRLVPHANRFKCTEVVNVDAHSDIVNFDRNGGELKLNCGTWANFLKVRKNFHWIYPKGRKMKSALCHWPQTDEYSPFVDPARAGWENTTKEAVDEFPMGLMRNNAAIGIAISFEYLPHISSKRNEMLNIMTDVFGKAAMPKTFVYWGDKLTRGTVMKEIGR